MSGNWPCPPAVGQASGGHGSSPLSRARQAGRGILLGERSCWHNCGSSKSSNLTAALPGPLRDALELLYRPSEEALRFHAAGHAGGGVAFIGWGQAVL